MNHFVLELDEKQILNFFDVVKFEWPRFVDKRFFSCFLVKLSYRLDMYELLNRVRVTAANELAYEFRIVLPQNTKIRKSTILLYTRPYGYIIA